MATKKVQIGFRVTEGLRKLIEAQALKRDLSVQDFITSAIEYYSKTPTNWDYSTTTFMKHRGVAEDQANEQHAWIDLWINFINRMPREKVLLLAETMRLDLRHYKSSRRKPQRNEKVNLEL